MFVPYPRNPDGDGIYYLSTIPSGFALIRGAKNPEGAILLTTCVRFKLVDPTVINIDKKQLKEKLAWSQEMLDMYDECKRIAEENVRMFYTGNFPSTLQTVYNNIDWGIVRRNDGSWAQVKEKYGDQLSYYLGEVNERIASYEWTGN